MGKGKINGKSNNAQTRGVPPRDCPECGKTGFVYDTRSRSGYVWRRHKCNRRHRWTSIETLVTGSAIGTATNVTAMAIMKREVLQQVIKALKDSMPKIRT